MLTNHCCSRSLHYFRVTDEGRIIVLFEVHESIVHVDEAFVEMAEKLAKSGKLAIESLVSAKSVIAVILILLLSSM